MFETIKTDPKHSFEIGGDGEKYFRIMATKYSLPSEENALLIEGFINVKQFSQELGTKALITPIFYSTAVTK